MEHPAAAEVVENVAAIEETPAVPETAEEKKKRLTRARYYRWREAHGREYYLNFRANLPPEKKEQYRATQRRCNASYYKRLKDLVVIAKAAVANGFQIPPAPETQQ